MSYAKDDYSGITPMISLNKSVTVDGGLIAKSLAIGGEKNRLVVREDGVYIGCPCKFDDDGAPMEEEQLRYYSLHSVIEAIQELNRRTAWMENDLGVSESFALTDQSGDNNVNTYHSTTKDLLPGLKNLKEIEEDIGEALRTGYYPYAFSTGRGEWEDDIWTYTFTRSVKEGHEVVTFNVQTYDTSITDDKYTVPYGVITDSTGKTAIVTSMNNMFYFCESLTSLDLSGWNTSNITDMSGMFVSCSSLTSLDLSGWNTSNVTDMHGMFSYCNRLTTLDVSGWNTSKIINMNDMFYYCNRLTTVKISQTGAKILDELLELSTDWIIEGETTTMEDVKNSSDWLADFRSDTLTFTRTL